MTLIRGRSKDDTLERLAVEIEKLTREVAKLKGERDAQEELLKYKEDILQHKQRIEKLKIEEDRLKEKHEREKREVAHKVGLERKRQEFEADQAMKAVEQARKEAALEVREENLTEAQTMFQKQMDFMTERFEEENSYVRGMLGTIVEYLPNVNWEISGREKETADV